MIKSMTGHGLTKIDHQGVSGFIEIRTLNSKYLDVSLKIPAFLNSYEMKIREEVGNFLNRGKINVHMELVLDPSHSVGSVVNEKVFKQYYESFKTLAKQVDAPTEDIFRLTLGVPEVMASGPSEEIDISIWEIVEDHLAKCLEMTDNFRRQEGDKLELKFKEYLTEIKSYLDQVQQFEPTRLQNLKDRIHRHISEHQQEIDSSRFEQEILYYIEKLDISEEKVRLLAHLDYFQEVLELPESNGKKLNFICQEIGREINTMGSKANDANIQRLVVNMKEELEKIKEQVLNIV